MRDRLAEWLEIRNWKKNGTLNKLNGGQFWRILFLKYFLNILKTTRSHTKYHFGREKTLHIENVVIFVLVWIRPISSSEKKTVNKPMSLK